MLRDALRHVLGLSRQFLVRVVLVASLGVVAVVAVKATSTLLWEGAAESIGAQALNRLLDIIATSMLAATTFSLTVMVAVHRGAAQQFTPRIHQSLLNDTVTQTVLSTFVGAWVYALTAIVLLSTPLFGEREVVALYLTTLVVLVLIVGVLVRWILHLRTLGTYIDTVARIEAEAAEALRQRPWRTTGGLEEAPPAPYEETASSTGYVGALDLSAIQRAAEEADAQVHLLALPGRFVSRGEALARTSTRSAALSAALGRSIPVGPLRTCEQDPLFGLVRLSEIGSKALSPAVNDPGTAVDILGRMSRVLGRWPEGDEGRQDRLWLPRVSAAEFFVAAFDPIARDGAGLIEVQVAMQERLAGLALHAGGPVAQAARQAAVRAAERGRTRLSAPQDLARLEAAAAWIRG